MKKKIIIVGYPKSGTTWVARLTAELVNCPVKGILYNEKKNEIAIEGLERKSEYECYKSHRQIHELTKEDVETGKIIYVIRDPRDLYISGYNYFYNIKLLPNFLHSKLAHYQNFKFIEKKIKNTIGKWLMKKKMIKAILFGNKNLHYWCRISWGKHLIPYLDNSSVLKVKYESLLNNPFNECERILSFIGIEKPADSIIAAIEKQSFNAVKEKFVENGESRKANFLRKGKNEQWKKELSKKEKRIFNDLLKKELDFLDYDTKL